ncbi:MAG: DUF427 domain-containing protein [Deinococcota bacterium]|jgi:uncharacterized protein (DUF427 family)|nr:DUF427 domain-containing protein [Deinococcota bacterium]
MKAIWNNTVIAASEDTALVEGNHYFPKGSLHSEYFKSSDHHTTCPWKGVASYYHLEVDGKTNENAAWTYLEPKEAAAEIKEHVAFWKGVEVA